MIYKAKREDSSAIARLAIQMWEDNTIEDLSEEVKEIMSSDESAYFLL